MGADSGENFLTVVAKNFDVLAGPLVALVYPLCASIKAIESGSRAEDEQWLTYWVLYSLITIFELSFSKVLEWFPIWSYAKLFFTCWLVLPQFNGATYVYKNFIRPFYMNPQRTTSTIWYMPRTKNLNLFGPFARKDDVLIAAERYIEENGTEAFERLIRKGWQWGGAGAGAGVYSNPHPHLRPITYCGGEISPHSHPQQVPKPKRALAGMRLKPRLRQLGSESEKLWLERAERDAKARRSHYMLFEEDDRYY